MNEKQMSIYEELKYICRSQYNNDKEKMMYDIIEVLCNWSNDIKTSLSQIEDMLKNIDETLYRESLD